MTSQSESIESLKQKVSQLQTENKALKSDIQSKGQLSNEAVDGIIFTVVLIAVVTGLALWLGHMPA